MADFPHLKITEMTTCNDCITEDEIWVALNKVGKDKNGHLWLTQQRVLEIVICICSLAETLQHLDGTEHYSPTFKQVCVEAFKMKKHGRDGISNF